MRRLTLTEILTATATKRSVFKTLRRLDLLAFAFGRREGYASLSYLEIDGVALLLAGTLSRAYTRKVAAQLVRADTDVWGHAVALAEATMAPAYYVVLDLRVNGQKATKSCCTASTDAEAIAAALTMDLKHYEVSAERVTAINIACLIRVMRETGAAHGIDLIGSFLPPPDHQQYAELFAPFTKLRDRAVASVRARKNREELARQAGEVVRTTAEAQISYDERRAAVN